MLLADIGGTITGGTTMIRKLLLPTLAVVLLGGCMTSGYGYRNDRGDYYYGQPGTEYRHYGAPYGYGSYYGGYPYYSGSMYYGSRYYGPGYPYYHGGYYRPPLVIRPRPDHDRPPQRDNDSRAPWRDLDQIKRIRSGSPGIQRAATTPRPAVQRPAVSAPVRPAVRASDGRGSRTQQAIRRARTQAREVER